MFNARALPPLGRHSRRTPRWAILASALDHCRPDVKLQLLRFPAEFVQPVERRLQFLTDDSVRDTIRDIIGAPFLSLAPRGFLT